MFGDKVCEERGRAIEGDERGSGDASKVVSTVERGTVDGQVVHVSSGRLMAVAAEGLVTEFLWVSVVVSILGDRETTLLKHSTCETAEQDQTARRRRQRLMLPTKVLAPAKSTEAGRGTAARKV